MDSLGGYCLITVPAFMKLWSNEDVDAGHFRRYTIDSLNNVVAASGLSIVYESYFFGFLYLPILVIRARLEKMMDSLIGENHQDKQKRMNSQQRDRRGIVGAVLRSFERRELQHLQKGEFISRGSSILLVARKNSDLKGKHYL